MYTAAITLKKGVCFNLSTKIKHDNYITDVYCGKSKFLKLSWKINKQLVLQEILAYIFNMSSPVWLQRNREKTSLTNDAIGWCSKYTDNNHIMENTKIIILPCTQLMKLSKRSALNLFCIYEEVHVTAYDHSTI